jgi:hypothetical protein
VTSFEAVEKASGPGSLVAIGLAALTATHLFGRFRDTEPGWAGGPKKAEQVKGQLDRIRRKREAQAEPDFEVAILGAGAAAAYYLQTEGQNLDPKRTVIIGNEQPWAWERGALGDVNHPVSQIDPRRDAAPALDPTKGLASRPEFSALIADVFANWPFHLEEQIGSVTRTEGGDRYEVSLSSGRTISARRVIAALGGGKHKEPENLTWLGAEPGVRPKNLPSALGEPLSRIMNMDEFQRAVIEKAFARDSIKRVVLVGPNAAIDVMTTLLRSHAELGVTAVEWIKARRLPPFLPGTDNAYAAKIHDRAKPTPGRKNVRDTNDGPLGIHIIDSYYRSATADEHGVQVSYDGGEAPVGGDIMVYGLGPDVEALAGLLGLPATDLAGALEPIYDVNRRFNAEQFTDEAMKAYLRPRVGSDPAAVLTAVKGVLAEGRDVTGSLASALKRPEEELPQLLPAVIGLRRRSEGGAGLEFVGATAVRLTAQSGAGYTFLSESLRRFADEEVKKLQKRVGIDRAHNEFVAELAAYVAVARRVAGRLEGVRGVTDLDMLGSEIAQLNTSFAELQNAADAVGNRSIQPVRQDFPHTVLGVYGQAATYQAQLTEFIAFLEANPQSGALASTHASAVVNTLPRNVAQGDQLAAERSAIGARHAALPENVAESVDFIGRDHTAIAAHIDAKYRDIPGLIADYLTARIVAERRHLPLDRAPLPRAVDPNDPRSKFTVDQQVQFQTGWSRKLDQISTIFARERKVGVRS